MNPEDLKKFADDLHRLHCIDGDKVLQFVADPVRFFIRADWPTQQAIWQAMENDKEAWAKLAHYFSTGQG